LFWLEKLVSAAAAQQAEIICFPESYLPGYPGMAYPPEDRIASAHSIAVIVPMDWHSSKGILNIAYVFSGES